jgi:C_GCAxxG_C_C family probable redox protein
MESEINSRIASGFAGGIGNTGAVCGAVVGAVMAIGLKQGRDDASDDGSRTSMEEMLGRLGVAREFRRRFEAEMETISCRELTGIDLSTEEGLKQLMSSDTPLTVCVPAVGVAYRLVVDLLNETS